MKFKYLIILLFSTFCCLQVNAQESTETILENALIKAKTENKNVFVKYGASWCGWCKKMDNQMKGEACKNLFEDNYVIVHLVVNERPDKKSLENPGSTGLLKEHNGEGQGLPYFVVLDNNGTLLEDSKDANGNNIGCPVSEKEVEAFTEILKNTSDLNEEQLEVISTTFVKK